MDLTKLEDSRSEEPNKLCAMYHPCASKSGCGKECPCLVKGTSCEKYCGCSRTCKNRYRGCYCVKSQCRSGRCPCFIANRECDPDVCRNCWIRCGDIGLRRPYLRGDKYECRNMKMLSKEHKRVFLGLSDVCGWGVFLQESVKKDEYIGEYTGEMISHQEAERRGKIYDLKHRSFLFNLNDEWVLDANRMGNKLKFANHSSEPNCYAKVMMVRGDHKVGIFAKKRIFSGQELFYDYNYEAHTAPSWAKKPEKPGSKKDEAGPSRGRRRKLT